MYVGTGRKASADKKTLQRREAVEGFFTGSAYLFFSLPRGATAVMGGVGRSETDPPSLGSEVSFLGFFAILLLCICPLAIHPPDGLEM